MSEMTEEEYRRRYPGRNPSTQLTPELIAHIAGLVQLGTPVRMACMEAGVATSTARRWLSLGGFEMVHNDSRIGPSQTFVPHEEAKEPYKSFVEAITRAQGKAYGQLARWAYSQAKVDGDLGWKILKSVASEDYVSTPRGGSASVSVINNNVRPVPVGRISLAELRQLEEQRNAIEAESTTRPFAIPETTEDADDD